MNDHNELIERCKEICAWQDTGLLKGDALRNFAKSRPYCNQINSVSMAETETLREVADAFIASVDRIAELESSLAATSDMVNKAFADGKAEGHGDATEEASVVIGELRARVAELKARLSEVVADLEMRSYLKRGEEYGLVDVSNGVYMRAKKALGQLDGEKK